MNIKITKDLDDPRLLQFLLGNKDATIYHHPAWLKAIKNTFKKDAYYILFENNYNNIDGLIPFITSKSFITGKQVISLPFSAYCNPLADKIYFNDAVKLIQSEFSDFNKIEFRTTINDSETFNNFSKESEYCTHIIELDQDLDQTFNSLPYSSIKSRIKKSEKSNLDIYWGYNINDLKNFYHLEVKLRKRLLLPPLPFSFFKNIWLELKNNNLISIPQILKDNKVIAAGFILNFKDTFYLEYTASNPDFLNFHPNHKLIFEIIKEAHNNGAKKIDFGRSSNDNESLIKFKEQWNGKRHPIFHFITPRVNTSIDKRNKLKNFLMSFNSLLPEKFLELEGKIIYKHFL